MEEITTGKRGNRKRIVIDQHDSHTSPVISEPTDTTQLSEVQESTCSINNAITHLLKLSALIREASPRDRYSKAAAAVEDRFVQKEIWLKYDKMHVSMKFPKLEADGKDWLIERLGEAATRRRQFLHYCGRHRELLGRGIDDEQDRIVVSSANADVEESEEMKSHLAPSEATTLATPDLHLLQESEDSDARSQTSASSFATSVYEGNEDYQRRTVINLSEVQRDGLPFECPHCCGIQTLRTQRNWQKHVFADLKAYVCLGESCNLTMFSDRQTWFLHEIQHHLSEWQCWYCSTKPHSQLEQYEKHMIAQHSSEFKIEQLPALSEISRRPPQEIRASTCPFCDWPALIRSKTVSSHVGSSEEIFVPKARYRKHVASHLEQLALFVLPVNFDDSGDESDDEESTKSVDNDVMADSIPAREGLIDAPGTISLPISSHFSSATLTWRISPGKTNNSKSYFFIPPFDTRSGTAWKGLDKSLWRIGHIIPNATNIVSGAVINRRAVIPYPKGMVLQVTVKDYHLEQPTRRSERVNASFLLRETIHDVRIDRIDTYHCDLLSSQLSNYIRLTLGTLDICTYLEHRTKQTLLSSWSVYMISGLKIATGYSASESKRRDYSVGVKLPGVSVPGVSVGVDLGFDRREEDSASEARSGSFILAMQLIKISKKAFSDHIHVEPYGKGAQIW